MVVDSQLTERRVKIIRRLWKREGVSFNRLSQLTPENLTDFEVSSAEELVDLMLARLNQIDDEQARELMSLALNMDQTGAPLLLDRIAGAYKEELYSSKTLQRRLESIIRWFVRFDGTIPHNPESQGSCSIDKVPAARMKSLISTERRVERLESLLKQLLASPHVAESTKSQIRSHLPE